MAEAIRGGGLSWRIETWVLGDELSGSPLQLVAWPRRVKSVKAYRDDLRAARFFHRHAVQSVRPFHRALVVRHRDELRLFAHLADETGKAVDVGVVERSIDFIEDTERRRLVFEDPHQKGDRGHRFLPAGEEEDRLVAFPGRLRGDLDSRVEED